MRKIIAFLLCLAMGGVIWVFGYKTGAAQVMNPQIYHANTVGSQIIQINDMYKKMDAFGLNVFNDRVNYNKDILTVIDCSQLLKSLSSLNTKDPRLNKFKEGIEVAWSHAKNSKRDIVFCNKDILRWVKNNGDNDGLI